MSNAYLIDAFTRHQVLLQRYANRNVTKIIPVLRSVMKDIKPGLTEFSQARVNAVIRDINTIIAEHVDSMHDTLTPELRDLATYEMEFTERALGGAVSVRLEGVSVGNVLATLTRKKMTMVATSGKVSKLTIRQAFSHFSGGMAADVAQVIRAGVVEGLSGGGMTTQINQMIKTRSRSQAAALVRTVTNYTARVSQAAVFKANSKVIDSEVYRATLDGRTTLFCMGEDGNVYSVGVGPQPPAHWQCRSIRVPRVKKEYQLPGLGGRRASMHGPVDSRTTYGGWLRRQPKEFQDETLGPQRAKLFRRGLSIKKFTDDGRVLTLKELEAMEGIVL